MANEQEADKTSELAEQITDWTGMRLQDILRATEDRVQWTMIIHIAVNSRIEEDWRQDKTALTRLVDIICQDSVGCRIDTGEDSDWLHWE